MRVTQLLTVVFIFLFSTDSVSQEEYWQQFVHYTMDVTLLPIEHSIVAEASIEYTNNSPDTLQQIFMHLYPNAYKDEHTVYVTEARRFFQKIISSPQDGGFIEIESFAITYPEANLPAGTEHTDFEIRDTILEATLPQPLPPAGKLTISLSFRNKIRKHVRRSGYRGFQYDMAQWYPKVCVYDENGWHARPFHYLGEFYGEFGTFDITIHTPFEYIIGATGAVSAGDPGWQSVLVDTAISRKDWPKRHKEIQENLREKAGEGAQRSVTFHAENVHDFAWVTSPDFLYEQGEWDGIPIHVLYRSKAKWRWSKVVSRRAAKALAWLSEKFGRYPYPQLSVTHGLLGGGMEYPMLVMNSTSRESIILHEVGHIYFYGILANNEWKEPWLDEGFTDFQTRQYMEAEYGHWGFNRDLMRKRSTWLQKHRPMKTERARTRDALLGFMQSGHDEPLGQIAHHYNEPGSYYRNVYDKGAFFFDMLGYVVGDSTFALICKEYFRRWQFKHVNEARFRQVCEDVSGQSLKWFFDQWLRNTAKIDYALGKTKTEAANGGWRTEVTVLKKAEGVMPVEVQVTTADGEQKRQRLGGLERIGKVLFNTESKPENVMLDPDDKILESRRNDNGKLGTRFGFEYPGMTFLSRDEYITTWRPSGWYNSVDDLRIGGRLRSRLGIYRNTELGLWYGTGSKELDVRFRYSNPVKALGNRTRGYLLAAKMEGRQEIDVHLRFVKSKYLRGGTEHRIWVGFNHTRLLNSAYTMREFSTGRISTWDEGSVNKLYARYNVNPRGMHWFTSITLGLDMAQQDWASDYSYNSLFSEIKFWAPSRVVGLFARIFAKGISDGADAPSQEMIYVDGANPRARFKRFFLRSAGALPEKFHYHQPGGGNVRGYYNNPIAGDRVWALNLELRKRMPVLRSLQRFGMTTVVAFFDVASVGFANADADLFADAGVGFRLQKRLPDDWYTLFTGGRNLALRLDFPLWLNRPLPGENSLRFRWVAGFDFEL